MKGVWTGEKIKDKGKRIKVGRMERASGVAPFFGYRMQDAGCKRKVTSNKLLETRGNQAEKRES